MTCRHVCFFMWPIWAPAWACLMFCVIFVLQSMTVHYPQGMFRFVVKWWEGFSNNVVTCVCATSSMACNGWVHFTFVEGAISNTAKRSCFRFILCWAIFSFVCVLFRFDEMLSDMCIPMMSQCNAMQCNIYIGIVCYLLAISELLLSGT